MNKAALSIAPGTICKLCRRHRPYEEFVWRDSAGQLGVTQRCVACRNRGKRDKPGEPKLRYPITKHAVERYIERVRPDLAALRKGRAHQIARLEMRRLMAYAPWEREWPEWAGDRAPHRDESVGFLLIDEHTLFLLSSDPNGSRVVVTVLTNDQDERKAA